MAVGEFLSDVMGGKNESYSDVQGPDTSLYRLPNQDQNRDMLQTYTQNAGNMRADQVQGQQLNSGQSQETRGLQQQLSSALMQGALGNGPSAAQAQLQRSQEDAIMAARSAAASAGGDSNPYLAQRAANEQMGRAMAQGGQQAAILRAQEQQAAQAQLAGQLQGMRGQDMDLSMQQAQLNQQANLANQQANLQQNAQNQQAMQYGMSGQMGLDSQQLQANMNLSGAQMQNNQYNNSQNMQVSAANAANAGSYGQAAFQGLMSAASTAAMMSDERLKTDVDRDSTDHEIDSFLDALDPASYTYINPKHGEGRHWSVMAQSAAKTPVGRSFVVETPDGLGLDTKKASAVALTALATLNKRINKLEKRD